MVDQVLVDEIVSDIKSGKKDLRECVEDYERQLDEEDGKFAIQLRAQEESYGSQIEDLDEEIEELNDSLTAKSDKIDDLNYLIEELRVTISNQEKEIDILGKHVEYWRQGREELSSEIK